MLRELKVVKQRYQAARLAPALGVSRDNSLLPTRSAA
jgi:hypothetical protein